MSAFQLHPTLSADSCYLGDLPLCAVLLARESRYPWLILVPREAQIREIFQLGEAGALQLMRESCELSRLMQAHLKPDKLNVAAIGNMVPQLHLHHVARFEGDAAWPKPIWGLLPPAPHAEEALYRQAAQWQLWLGELPDFVARPLG